jgi:hypothetical protein
MFKAIVNLQLTNNFKIKKQEVKKVVLLNFFRITQDPIHLIN